MRRDLNVIVATGKNWSIPFLWGPLLRYISAPILAIIFGFSYSSFNALREDPLHILGFGVAHICLIIIGAGVLAPRWFDVLIPPKRRGEGKIPYAPNVVQGTAESLQSDVMETAVAEDEVKTNDSANGDKSS